MEREENTAWAALTHEQKNHLLFLKQKELLDQFLETHAISRAQHDKSLRDLMEKMGEQETGEQENTGPATPQDDIITVEEIPAERIGEFWELHIRYLIDDGIITDAEDVDYFTGQEYRGILEEHMFRDTDRQHMVYFRRDGERIGAASYCTYQSEDGKCFLLDFWVFPRFRGNGTGRRCFAALEQYAREDGALYFELNSTKENSIRFWKSLGFAENGTDEYDMPLFIRK